MVESLWGEVEQRRDSEEKQGVIGNECDNVFYICIKLSNIKKLKEQNSTKQ